MSRYRVKNYTISGQTITLTDFERITKADIRLIVDETVPAVICSSMQKDKVAISNNVITVPVDVCRLGTDDALTIELDFADSPASDKAEIITEIGNAKTAILADTLSLISKVDALATTQGTDTTAITNAIANVITVLQGADAETLTSIRTAISNAQTAIVNALPNDYATSAALTNAVTSINSAVQSAITSLQGTDAETLTTIKSAIISAISTLQGANAESLTSVKAAIADAITALQGINVDATLTAILTKVTEFATGLRLVKNEDGEDTWTLVLDKSAQVTGTTLNV